MSNSPSWWDGVKNTDRTSSSVMCSCICKKKINLSLVCEKKKKKRKKCQGLDAGKLVIIDLSDPSLEGWISQVYGLSIYNEGCALPASGKDGRAIILLPSWFTLTRHLEALWIFNFILATSRIPENWIPSGIDSIGRNKVRWLRKKCFQGRSCSWWQMRAEIWPVSGFLVRAVNLSNGKQSSRRPSMIY